MAKVSHLLCVVNPLDTVYNACKINYTEVMNMLPAFLSAILLGIICIPIIKIRDRKIQKEREREKELYYKALATRIVYIIKDAEFMPDYRIIATFGSGKKRNFDASYYVSTHSALKDLSVFSSGKIVNGSIVWNDDIVLSAEYVYQHSDPCE